MALKPATGREWLNRAILHVSHKITSATCSPQVGFRDALQSTILILNSFSSDRFHRCLCAPLEQELADPRDDFDNYLAPRNKHSVKAAAFKVEFFERLQPV